MSLPTYITTYLELGKRNDASDKEIIEVWDDLDNNLLWLSENNPVDYNTLLGEIIKLPFDEDLFQKAMMLDSEKVRYLPNMIKLAQIWLEFVLENDLDKDEDFLIDETRNPLVIAEIEDKIDDQIEQVKNIHLYLRTLFELTIPDLQFSFTFQKSNFMLQLLTKTFKSKFYEIEKTTKLSSIIREFYRAWKKLQK